MTEDGRHQQVSQLTHAGYLNLGVGAPPKEDALYAPFIARQRTASFRDEKS
jgi:hypothetical protein